MHELNQNKDLYNALVRSMDHYERLASHREASTSTSPPSAAAAAQGGPEVLEGYTREAVLVGRLLVRDFEKAGVHLPDQQRQLTAELTARIGQTGYAISQSVAHISAPMGILAPQRLGQLGHQGEHCICDILPCKASSSSFQDTLWPRGYVGSLVGKAWFSD